MLVLFLGRGPVRGISDGGVSGIPKRGGPSVVDKLSLLFAG